MIYRHINRRPTPEKVLAHLGRTDIPITNVSVTQGYTDEGEPFVEVDFGHFELSAEEERFLKGYLGDSAPEMDDLKARLQRLENQGPAL